ISGLAILEDLTVAKALAVAVGAGAIIMSIETGLGFASFHIKPFLLTGIVAGGFIFGIGMAILGYCPGTLAISLGEGSLDALAGIAGALTGGLIYTLMLPTVSSILGPDLGTLSLMSFTGRNAFFYILSVLLGGIFIWLAFVLHRKEKGKNYKWLYTGLALAVLDGFVFLTSSFNRPIGASTTYPYLADLLTGTTSNGYFTTISKPGHWEFLFLTGAVIAGLLNSINRKEFKLTLIHSNWERFKGKSPAKRIFWAFTGGFILILGARMAGGCTSGHILSGGMQLAVSSLVFAVFVFAGLLLTGKLFYKES
ncbi:MAG TPA: YeeE/YedE thiosulfate transporter family protein, partial [Bacteroidales bacterium]|nr:YeeE/YedE thiosulfate transporter family protein [Bacteroidales bacterium]